LVIHHLHYLYCLLSLDLSYSKHSQEWSPWKHSLCPLILVCDVFFEQYKTVYSSHV
jgi:hypothetical protein